MFEKLFETAFSTGPGWYRVYTIILILLLITWLILGVKVSIKKPPATKEDLDRIAEDLRRLYDRVDKQFSDSKAQITDKYQGFSLHTVLSIHQGKRHSQRYLYDVGGESKNRISIYLDPSDNLTFRLLDSQGESYSVKVSSKDLPYDKFIYLACEAGVRENSSFLKAFIDGRQVTLQEIPLQLTLLSSIESLLNSSEGVFGADRLGGNGSRVDVAEIVLYSSTLTTDEIMKLLAYFKNKKPEQYISFSEKQWMRMTPGRGMHQENPDLQPRILKLESTD